MPGRRTPRIWLLALVLPGRYGRWFTAVLLFVASIAIFWVGGILGDKHNGVAVEVKSVALFFSVIVAYLIPTFHYVSERTEIAVESLVPELRRVTTVPSEFGVGTALRENIPRRTWLWQLGNLAVSVSFWLVQSWFLAGGFKGMVYSLTNSTENALMALGALPVWIVVTVVISALTSNAKLFRRLARAVPVDVLHTGTLMAFGRMAVSAVLVVIGAQASFSIMFFGGVDTPWAWGPGLLTTTVALVYLLLGPVMPLRHRLRSAKTAALAKVDQEIRRLGDLNELAVDSSRRKISELIVIRDEVRRTPEWPFDMDLLARLSIYLIIVPLTWVGAALIENVVDLFLGS